MVVDFDELNSEFYPEWGNLQAASQKQLIEIMGSEKDARELHNKVKVNKLEGLSGSHDTEKLVKSAGVSNSEHVSSISKILNKEFAVFMQIQDEKEQLLENKEVALDEEFYSKYGSHLLIDDSEENEPEYDSSKCTSWEEERNLIRQVLDVDKSKVDDKALNKYILKVFKLGFDEEVSMRLKALSTLSNHHDLKIVVTYDVGDVNQASSSYYWNTAMKDMYPGLFQAPNISTVFYGDEDDDTNIQKYFADKSLDGDAVVFVHNDNPNNIQNCAEMKTLHAQHPEAIIQEVNWLSGPAVVELAQELAKPDADSTIYKYSEGIHTIYEPCTETLDKVIEGNYEVPDKEEKYILPDDIGMYELSDADTIVMFQNEDADAATMIT
jgi:hypothetical protein